MSIDRLPSENDKQYLAYTCYRDLGLGRSMLAAQRVYDQKMGKVAGRSQKKRTNSSFDSWGRANNWDDRVRDWDLERELSEADAMRAANDIEYTQGLEKYRKLVRDSGFRLFASANLAIDKVDEEMKGNCNSEQVYKIACILEKSATTFTKASELVERAYSVNLLLDKMLENEDS